MPLEKKELQIQPLIFAVIQCLLVLFVFFYSCLAIPLC